MSAIGFPFSAGGNIGINFNAGGVVGASATPGQTFQNIPLPNTKLALYRLSIRAPGGSQQATQDYTFPLSPQSINQEFDAKSNVYDVAGSSSTAGVTRVADLYGNSAVTYVIEGTTGWQQHSTDNYQYTGMQSIAAIVALINSFAAQNAQQLQNNSSDVYTMEFYDYFSDQYWQVIPIGKQVVKQDAQRPLLFYYSFRFAGIMNLNSPQTQTTDDPVLNTLSSSTSQATTNLNQSITSTLNNYINVTAGALGDLL
jgi:hypothetical protein